MKSPKRKTNINFFKLLQMKTVLPAAKHLLLAKNRCESAEACISSALCQRHLEGLSFILISSRICQTSTSFALAYFQRRSETYSLHFDILARNILVLPRGELNV